MRDAERLRERLELSLDTGQVIALLVCALLLLGGVFAVGLMIGRRASAAQGVAPASGDLAALDAEARRPHVAPQPRREEAPRPRPVEADAAPKKAVATDAPEAAPSVIPPPVQTATVVPAPQRPAQVQPAVSALTPPPRDVGAFTVQVGASQDRSEAARLESRARGAGLKPYVVEANLGAKGTWYRVRVGAFRDKDAANHFRNDVERELRTAAVVMPTR